MSVKRPDLGERDTGTSNAHVDLLSIIGKVLPEKQVRATSRNPTVKALYRQMFERFSRIAEIIKSVMEDLKVCGPHLPNTALVRSGKSFPRDGRKVLDKLKFVY